MNEPIDCRTTAGVSGGSEIHFNDGAISQLSETLDARGARSVFLVYDRHAYRVSGAEQAVEDQLAGREIARFAEFTPNPQLEEIERGVEKYVAAPRDVIVGVGGGSALDVAKMISIFSGNRHAQSEQLVRQQATIERPGPPVIAIPTTSGTGAEVTHFSALYLQGVKHSVAHPYVLPTVAIVDPQLTHSVPPQVTASTGLDACCQAMESLWAVGSTAVSQDHAAEALSLALQYLTRAVRAPCPESRRGMARAAHLAGRAINISKTTASHALSYTLTADFGVPHGQAVALTIGALLAYNAGVTDQDCVDPRGPGYVCQSIARILNVLGCEDVASGQRKMTLLVQSIDCPTNLSEIGAGSLASRQAIAARCNAERMSNNPRRLDTKALEQLLEEVA